MARNRNPSHLSNTGAIAGKPFGSGQDHSISVREIENGHIVRTSSCNARTGEYTSSEQFVKENPRITPAKLDGRQGKSTAGNESLSDTRRYLGEDI